MTGGINIQVARLTNVNPAKPSKGNSRSYLVSRLQREKPDLFEMVKEHPGR